MNGMMPRMDERTRLVDVGDTRLYVAERGDGFPLIVLHGGPGLDHVMWADYLDPLADAYRLVLVDQRSQGRSDPAGVETLTLERMAADVTALAAALDLGPYAVLGHSFGAFVALQHAVDFAGEPAGTIVSSGIPSARFLADLQERLDAFEPADLRNQVVRSWADEATVSAPDGMKRLLDDQMPWHFADPRDPRIADYNARTAGLVGSPDVIRHFAVAEYGGIEVEALLPTVTHPVLVLAGRHDRTCLVEAAEAIADGVPGAELAIFENSGHMTYVEEQPHYLEVVRDFLDRVRR
jgi:proline iminopeptidase